MTEIRFNFHGWWALLAIPILVGVYLLRVYSIESSIEGDAGASIRQHIAIEILQSSVDNIAHAESLSAVGADDIEIIESSARGSGEEIVVRVVFTINGSAPTDMTNVRYFRLRSSGIGSWRVQRECDVVSWWLKVF